MITHIIRTANFQFRASTFCPIVIVATALAVPMANSADGPLDDLRCLLEPSQVVELSSQQPGIVEKVLVERGDRVRKGQAVVHLAAGVERAVLELSQARHEFGLRKSERNAELVAKELLSSQEQDEMDTEVAVAAAELKEAEARLALRTIQSPISGVVIERYKSPGDYVGEDAILKLIAIDPLNVEVIVPVDALGQIKVGMTAEIKPDVVDKTLNATVIIVDPAVDPSSDSYGVRLRMDNPRNRVPAGLKCKIRFITR